MNINTFKFLTQSGVFAAMVLIAQSNYAGTEESSDTAIESATEEVTIPASVSTEKKPEKITYELFDFSDNAVQFENYIKAKQWTVVMFWASDCHICNVEVQGFVKLHAEKSDNNIRVLGVSIDGKAKKTNAQEFINIHGVNFPNLIGEQETIAKLYKHYTNENWVGTPTYVVFSPDGKIMAQRAGMLPPKLIVRFIENQ